MSSPVRPTHVASNGAFASWAIPAAFALILIASTTLWLAGGVLTLLDGGQWPAGSWSLFLLIEAFTETGGLAATWPAVSPTVLIAVWVVLFLALVVPPISYLTAKVMTRPKSDAASRSLAKRSDAAFMALPARRTQTRSLRPSLGDTPERSITPADAGIALGTLDSDGTPLFASWEDVIVAVMAPRSGKTTSLAIPSILNAPGPCIATSNKADLWAATAEIREARTKQRVWTFDPQGVARTDQTWWWPVLAGVKTVEEAERLAGHFVTTVEDERSRDIWGPAATELLASLVLAAAHANKPITHVYRWLSQETNKEPVDLLHEAGFSPAADSLDGLQKSAPETRASVFFTARAACKCLRDPDITAWVTPGTATETFDPAAFVVSKQTLYLMSKDGGGSAAPLVAALVDRVLRAGVRTAEATPASRRLDPPLVVALDEAANVARISDLPLLYSHFGSRGILPITILQSYAQGRAVWGDGGMKSLWSAATVKLIGAGMDDPEFAENISKLVGDHDVSTVSVSTGQGKRNTSTSLRQQRVLTAAQIRALPKGRALLLATGAKPAMVQLQPFYAGPYANQISSAITNAELVLATRSVHAETTGGR